jgi:hypothetical protein
MFCSNCGVQASGNFCNACGHRLAAVESAPPMPVGNWEDDVDPKTLLERPEVRAMIERSAAEAKKPIPVEEYFKLYDKLGVLPISAGTLVGIAQPFWAKLGVKTGKTRTETIASPPGRVLAALFCSLARKGRKVIDTQRGVDGCVVTAELPADLFAMAGELIVAVERVPGGTKVAAAASIKGQYFDWGKSARCLNGLFDDLRKAAVGNRQAA